MDNTVSITVPAALAPFMLQVAEVVHAFTEAAAGPADPNFATGEVSLLESVDMLSCAAIGSMLKALDPTAPRVEVRGVVYRRLEQDAPSTYRTLRGKVSIVRHLYREEGVRNGPTIVPLDLRAGVIDAQYTPAAALAFTRLAQAMPSREAEATCESLHVLPYSRSEHFRVGVEVGSRWEELRETAEPILVAEMELDERAAAVSVAIDRVSIPMAEPRVKTPDDVHAGVEKPLSVVMRMAYSAVWTLYNATGDPLQCVRYAHVPTEGIADMERCLTRDLRGVLARMPDLRFVTLADGAPEMQQVLDRIVSALNRKPSAQLVDFWHTAEKLGTAIAATGRYGDDLLSDWKDSLFARDDAIDGIHDILRAWSQDFAMPDPRGGKAQAPQVATEVGTAAVVDLNEKKEPIPDGLYDALTYLANNRERMRYATVRNAGLPIGSGTVEATGKTIVEVRMKRSGCRWVENTGGPQAILGLRSLATSEPRRWAAATARILASYRVDVIMLPPRTDRVRRAAVPTPTPSTNG